MTDARTVFAVVVGIVVLALTGLAGIIAIALMRGSGAIPEGLITLDATLCGGLTALLVSTRSGPPPPAPYDPGVPGA